MPYEVLEQKLRMIPEQDFEFVSRFLDMVLSSSKNRANAEYLEMLDRSYDQLEKGDVVVKSMSELRDMESA